MDNIVLTQLDRAMKEREANTHKLIDQCQDRIKAVKKHMIQLSNEDDRLNEQLRILRAK